MGNDNHINENDNNFHNNGQAHPIKKWLYIGVFIIGIIILFRSCFGCGTSNEDKDAKKVSGDKAKMECEYCGKTYTWEDTYYDSETGINYTCCSNCCAKCYAKRSKENDRKQLREGIKKARNKWVDDNPNEAKRRGIHKF